MIGWKMRGGNYPSICDSCHMLDIVMDRDEDLRGPYLEMSSNHSVYRSKAMLPSPSPVKMQLLDTHLIIDYVASFIEN